MSDAEALFERTMIMLALLTLVINLASFLKIRNIHVISETSLYVIFGFICGWIFVGTANLAGSGESRHFIQLNSNFFYMVLLPPIIFEGGFTLQRVAFLRNIFPIIALALVGATYSTVTVSTLMFGFTRLLYPSFTFMQSLIFGALISSTDPVSVLGMLPPSTDKNLYMLIFGESALNDAIAIILYRFFNELAEEEKTGLTLGKFFASIATSGLVFIGSLGVGVTLALIFAKLTKHVRPPETPIYELCMFLIFAYSSYLVADILELAGIISVFFCGMAMAHYAYDNLSKVTILASKVFLRTLSSMCDAFVFLYLGLGLAAFGNESRTFNIGMIAAATLAILIGRTHVFLIGWLNNMFARVSTAGHVIPVKHLVFLWFCGLRGAVSFALGVTLLQKEYIPHDIRALIFGTTIIVVTITVIFMGGLTPFMMRVLRLDEEGQKKDQEEAEALERARRGGGGGSHHQKNEVDPATGEPKKADSFSTLDEYLGPENTSGEPTPEFIDTMKFGFWAKVYEIDKQYIKPFFSVGAARRQGGNRYETLGSDQQNGEPSTEAISMQTGFRDDFDNVPLSVAAESIGMANSAKIIPQSPVADYNQSMSHFPAIHEEASQKEHASKNTGRRSIDSVQKRASMVSDDDDFLASSQNSVRSSVQKRDSHASTGSNDRFAIRSDAKVEPFIPTLPKPVSNSLSQAPVQESDQDSQFDDNDERPLRR